MYRHPNHPAARCGTYLQPVMEIIVPSECEKQRILQIDGYDEADTEIQMQSPTFSIVFYTDTCYTQRVNQNTRI